jgi:MSHA biogenesis protein MshI
VSQQINLYQPVLRTQKKVFTARTILELAGIFAFGLVLIFGYARYQLSGLEGNIAMLEQQRNAAMVQLQTLSEQVRPLPRAQLFDDQIRDAELDRERKQVLLRGFRDRRAGATSGFSQHLAGLARQRVDGLWLTRVLVRDNGIELAGHAEAGELLPRYLARLGREQAFTGTEFASFELQRGERAGDPASFRVATGAPEGNGR